MNWFRRKYHYLRLMVPLWFNYLVGIPFLGFSGTAYFNHLYSQAVGRMGYDSRSQTLDVHFRQGRSLYRYHEVSIWDFFALFRAESLGREMNRRIIRQKPCQHLTYYPNKGQTKKKNRQLGITYANGPSVWPGTVQGRRG